MKLRVRLGPACAPPTTSTTTAPIFTDIAVVPAFASRGSDHAAVPAGIDPAKERVWIHVADASGRRTDFAPIAVR